MRLNIGCGRNPLDGYLNVDFLGGDIRCNGMVLPFKDNTFERVLLSHVLEHIPDVDRALREISRILRVGGILIVVVPYGLRGLYCVYHVHAFDLKTMNVLLEGATSGLQGDGLNLKLLKQKITDYAMPLIHRYKWHFYKYLNGLWLVRPHEFSKRIVCHAPLGSRMEITAWFMKT